MPQFIRFAQQPQKPTRSTRFGGRRFRPMVENLEDRRVLATFVVDVALDEDDGNVAAGDVSLREAISQANVTAGADTITFDAALANQTITLGETLPVLSESVTIDASALSELTIDGNNESRIFFLDAAGEQFTLRGLTLTNANTSQFSGGAAIRINAGELQLEDSTLSGNSTDNRGGAILNYDTATIVNSTLSGNSAGEGGGIYNEGTLTVTNSALSGNFAATRGGGIDNFGAATIADSTFSGNSVDGSQTSGGAIANGSSFFPSTATISINSSTLTNNTADLGGGIAIFDGQAMIVDSTLSDNLALLRGGGILNSATATISSSTLSGNRALFDGGGINNDGIVSIINSTLSGNRGRDGGGLRNLNTVSISNSMLTGNTAFGGGGGGVYNGGEATITTSTLSGNTANDGGAIYSISAGTSMVFSSTLLGNTAGNGGGIHNSYGSTTAISNSTFSGNSAWFRGGGIYNNYGGMATIRNSTLFGNSAQIGGGIYNENDIYFGGMSAATTITNSIVANGLGATDISNTATLNGSFNLIGDGSYLGSFTDSVQGDPMLTSLADNGGPTLTHLPGPGSVVLDVGDPAAMAGVGDTPEFDQRGVDFQRVANGRIDIGAVEVQSITDPDFNDDGVINGLDIDMLQANIVIGPADPALFDLNGDGVVTIADRDEWLVQAGAANLPSGNAFLLGDANLDGFVDGRDFVEWNNNKFSTSFAWTDGDFNADGVVNGPDFVEWNNNKFQSADRLAGWHFVPMFNEPAFDSLRLATKPTKESARDRCFAQLQDDNLVRPFLLGQQPRETQGGSTCSGGKSSVLRPM